MKQTYLDYAAITPVSKKVEKRMIAVQRKFFGNPSSLHAKGLEAKKVLDESRENVARVLNCKAKEIIFTSGGTESANLAIFGLVSKGTHIISSNIEHHAVLNACKEMESRGANVTYVSVEEDGIIDPKKVISSIRPETILISIMYVNNEIGTIQPITEIGRELKKINKQRAAENLPLVLFHTDGCQAAGFLDLDVNRLGVDLLTLNGSKMYGPRHTGILFVRSGISLKPFIYGGGQERGLRSGTEDVGGAAGLALALSEADQLKEKESARLSKLRDYFISKVIKEIPTVIINGAVGISRLPNNVNISIPATEGESMVIYLSAKGIYCSTGSACSTAFTEPSHVILAISAGLIDRAKSSLRFSLGRGTSKSDVNRAVRELKKVYVQMRYTV